MSGPTIIATLEKNSRELVRIALDEYRGVPLVDVRVMAPAIDPTGLPIPTKKGIALRIELLPELVVALQAAEAEARRLGLLPAEEGA